jgi:Flp pilus assembly protein TadG
MQALLAVERSHAPFAKNEARLRSIKSSETAQTASALPATDRKLHKLFRSSRLYRRGAAVVEFAIVAPVLILLILGMIEYGRLVMCQQVLTNATREGARAAVLDGATTTSVTTVVSDFLTGSKISGATITVNPSPPSNAAFGAPVTVSVSIPFSQVSWLPTPMFLGSKTLTASTVMRRETVQ